MNETIQAFELKHAETLLDRKHSHPDQDPRSYEINRDYLQGMMDFGLTVSAWHAKPYKQPRWGIFKQCSLVPEPTIWIDISLHCEGTNRRNEIFNALAPDANGVLKQSTYVKKPKIKRKMAKKPKNSSAHESKAEGISHE